MLNYFKFRKLFPPGWKSLEQTSFGLLSKLYGNLKPTIHSKDSIAKELGAVNHTYLPSWLQSITHIKISAPTAFGYGTAIFLAQ